MLIILILSISCEFKNNRSLSHLSSSNSLPDLSPFELAAFQYSSSLKQMLSKKNISLDELEIYIRAFKKEEKLEVFGKKRGKGTYIKLLEYDFCASSGNLGPKRKEGDLQIPEGLYFINRFNPKSKFHLSLGLNYPNSSDLKFADTKSPGGDIFIHGDCKTVGCIPITDTKIRELYLLASFAKQAGQSKIPVHFFPFRLTVSNMKKYRTAHTEHLLLWNSLQIFYTNFEENKTLIPFTVLENGYYYPVF